MKLQMVSSDSEFKKKYVINDTTNDLLEKLYIFTALFELKFSPFYLLFSKKKFILPVLYVQKEVSLKKVAFNRILS